MKEQDFARSVRQRLDGLLDEVPQRVVDRLRAAREAALARAQGHRAASGPEPGGPGPRGLVFNVRALAPIAVVLLVLAGVLFWQQQARQVAPMEHTGLADVDTEVLTDDLPVVAYLDPGFEIWLYHHSPATAED